VTWSQGSAHEPWCVGVLFSQSGVMAVIDDTQLRAPLLAIDEIDQAGGVNAGEIVLIVYKPESYLVG
jgi:ABC-type branched-subunit amino acid transport system substrate-binding protein